MKKNAAFQRATLPILLIVASSAFTGCGNPGSEGQGQTHTPVTPNNQRAAPRQAVPTPPTADQIDPSSPRAVLGGTSTTNPSTGRAPDSSAPH